jgi:hypothetical protein
MWLPPQTACKATPTARDLAVDKVKVKNLEHGASNVRCENNA